MQTHEKDIYDLEVERLTKEPELIEFSWGNAELLFRYVGSSYSCGCLTMIKNPLSYYNHAKIKGRRSLELERAIQGDPMIPTSTEPILPAHLPHFAKWQRRIDRMNAGESFEEVMKEEKV